MSFDKNSFMNDYDPVEAKMNFLKINGVSVAVPSRKISYVSTTFVSSARNANAVANLETIGRNQYKLNGLEWLALNKEEAETLLSLLENFVFDVTFYNPYLQKTITIEMYTGDRKAVPYFVDSEGRPALYKSISCNLIDTGKTDID